PDGCVYVADRFDARTAHPDPGAEWDRSNGRIYRIAFGTPPKVSVFDLAKKSSTELVKLLNPPNDWYARTARRLLPDRPDPASLAGSSPAPLAGCRRSRRFRSSPRSRLARRTATTRTSPSSSGGVSSSTRSTAGPMYWPPSRRTGGIRSAALPSCRG